MTHYMILDDGQVFSSVANAVRALTAHRDEALSVGRSLLPVRKHAADDTRAVRNLRARLKRCFLAYLDLLADLEKESGTSRSVFKDTDEAMPLYVYLSLSRFERILDRFRSVSCALSALLAGVREEEAHFFLAEEKLHTLSAAAFEIKDEDAVAQVDALLCKMRREQASHNTFLQKLECLCNALQVYQRELPDLLDREDSKTDLIGRAEVKQRVGVARYRTQLLMHRIFDANND